MPRKTTRKTTGNIRYDPIKRDYVKYSRSGNRELTISRNEKADAKKEDKINRRKAMVENRKRRESGEQPFYGRDQGLAGSNPAFFRVQDYMTGSDIVSANQVGIHWNNQFALSSNPTHNREIMDDVKFGIWWEENIEPYYFTLPRLQEGKKTKIFRFRKDNAEEDKISVVIGAVNSQLYVTGEARKAKSKILKVRNRITGKLLYVYDWKYPVPTFDKTEDVVFDDALREWIRSIREGGDEWWGEDGQAKIYAEEQYAEDMKEYNNLKKELKWTDEQIKLKMEEFVNEDGTVIDFEKYFKKYKNRQYKSVYFEEQQKWVSEVYNRYEIEDLCVVENDGKPKCVIFGGRRKRSRRRKSKRRKRTKKKARRKRRRRSSKRRKRRYLFG